MVATVIRGLDNEARQSSHYIIVVSLRIEYSKTALPPREALQTDNRKGSSVR